MSAGEKKLSLLPRRQLQSAPSIRQDRSPSPTKGRSRSHRRKRRPHTGKTHEHRRDNIVRSSNVGPRRRARSPSPVRSSSKSQTRTGRRLRRFNSLTAVADKSAFCGESDERHRVQEVVEKSNESFLQKYGPRRRAAPLMVSVAPFIRAPTPSNPVLYNVTTARDMFESNLSRFHSSRPSSSIVSENKPSNIPLTISSSSVTNEILDKSLAVNTVLRTDTISQRQNCSYVPHTTVPSIVKTNPDPDKNKVHSERGCPSSAVAGVSSIAPITPIEFETKDVEKSDTVLTKEEDTNTKEITGMKEEKSIEETKITQLNVSQSKGKEYSAEKDNASESKAKDIVSETEAKPSRPTVSNKKEVNKKDDVAPAVVENHSEEKADEVNGDSGRGILKRNNTRPATARSRQVSIKRDFNEARKSVRFADVLCEYWVEETRTAPPLPLRSVKVPVPDDEENSVFTSTCDYLQDPHLSPSTPRLATSSPDHEIEGEDVTDGHQSFLRCPISPFPDSQSVNDHYLANALPSHGNNYIQIDKESKSNQHIIDNANLPVRQPNHSMKASGLQLVHHIYPDEWRTSRQLEDHYPSSSENEAFASLKQKELNRNAANHQTTKDAKADVSWYPVLTTWMPSGSDGGVGRRKPVPRSPMCIPSLQK